MRDWIRGAPDLVIEVLSPSTGSRDRGPKLKAYARFGVPEYWIVDPDNRAVEVYRLAQTGYPEPRRFLEPDILASPLLPAFALAVRDIFKSL